MLPTMRQFINRTQTRETRTRKHNTIANGKHTMVMSAGQKTRTDAPNRRAPMRSAPLLPQANSPNPNATTTNGRARERGSKQTRYSKFEISRQRQGSDSIHTGPIIRDIFERFQTALTNNGNLLASRFISSSWDLI